jgi:hypothetical protein
MTDKEIAQLGRELTPEEKTRLIRILCGPADHWDDAAGEFAMKLYGVEPNLSADDVVEILEGAVRKSRERKEPVPRSLLNVLTKLRKKAKARSKSEAKSRRYRSREGE